MTMALAIGIGIRGIGMKAVTMAWWCHGRRVGGKAALAIIRVR